MVADLLDDEPARVAGDVAEQEDREQREDDEVGQPTA